MVLVDDLREGRIGAIEPLARGRLTTCVLRGRDDLQPVALELFVDCLPPGQVESTTSPGGPGHQQDLLAAKVRKTNRLTLAVGELEVRRHRRLQIATPDDGDLPPRFLERGRGGFVGLARTGL